MRFSPLNAWLRRSVAVVCVLASGFLAGGVRAEAAPTARIAAASRLYFEGRGVSARRDLETFLQTPAAADPGVRRSALTALLDICIHMQARACLVEHAPQLAQAIDQAPAADPVLKRELARTAAYYVQAAGFIALPQTAKAIMDSPLWSAENAYNPDLYLRRQILAANVLLSLGRTREAGVAVDKVLSLIASLSNPEDNRLAVAWALADALDLLLQLGEVERAHGLYRASGDFVLRALPPASLDAATFRLTAANLLEQVADTRGAAALLDQAAGTLGGIELEEDMRGWLPANVETLRAVVCVAQADLGCARTAMASHPYAARYAQGAHAPASYEELTYLAARALVSAADGRPDPTAARSLEAPPSFKVADELSDRAEIYRLAGAALAQAPGPGRRARLAQAGTRLAAAGAASTQGRFGAWRRPGAVDRLLLGVVLAEAAAADSAVAPDAAFGLFQLAGRIGPSFDSDALTALGQAADALQRRSVHEALRAYARRNRLEREDLQRVARLASGPAGPARLLTHDLARRGLYRDLSSLLDRAARTLGEDGVSTAGTNLTPLETLQASLAPDEAALTVAPVFGGLSYMCVRHDAVRRSAGPADLQKLALDSRLLQNALTADYPPDEALDSQYPAEAAARLYAVLIRPFEGCLRPGDHILWLPSQTLVNVPLSALLERVPPKAGDGYDLAAADWLVKRRSIAYAGSAAMVVAARSGAREGDADLDFLGVGDPILKGATAAGEDREKLLLRGVSTAVALAGLPALPQTRPELEQSAKGFAKTRLLLGAGAAEHAFRAELVGAYRFLSFATHGLIREELPGLAEPALALTPVSSASTEDDGLLTASEIADLNLSARFVALSACNTARFDLAQMAADLPALSSAFAVAGTPSTLATLWSVDSETSRRVVAQVFATLRTAPALDPARALAQAQRAFLASPPSRAHLHPRFWAPFIVLGDGGGSGREAPAGVRVAAVERLADTAGGEVLAVAAGKAGVATRAIGGRDGGARHAGVVRIADRAGKQRWRSDAAAVAASKLAVELDGRLVVAGYRQGETGRATPTLQAFAPLSGAPLATWAGALPGRDAFVVAHALADPHTLVFVVAGRDFGQAPSAWTLQGYRTTADLAPERLFELTLPEGVKVDETVAAVVGGRLLLAYSQRLSAPGGTGAREDDFEQRVCGRATTWVELRDLATGAVTASTTLPGVVTAAALAEGAEALLAGSVDRDCEEGPRMAVFRIDGRLQASEVYVDHSLGESEVRSMAAAGDGSVLLAARKYGADRTGDAGAEPRSAALVTIDRRGRPLAVKMLDSGMPLYVSDVERAGPGRYVLGGSVGGDAALIHLEAPDAAR